MRTAGKNLLLGRTIVGFDPRPFPDGRGRVATHPLIMLDNGAYLTFSAQETEVDDYGVQVTYWPAPKRKAKRQRREDD